VTVSTSSGGKGSEGSSACGECWAVGSDVGVTARNQANPMVGSGMQQARKAACGQSVEAVRNSMDGPRSRCGSLGPGASAPVAERTVLMSMEGRSLKEPHERSLEAGLHQSPFAVAQVEDQAARRTVFL